MPVLRFRAWYKGLVDVDPDWPSDRDSPCMIYDVQTIYDGLGGASDPKGILAGYGSFGGLINDCEPNELHKGFVIMQSTGLKDRLGVEIFEGDIVKKARFVLLPNVPVKAMDLAIVAWLEGTTGWYPFGGQVSWGRVFRQLEPIQWEVVGNIYENKELLRALDRKDNTAEGQKD